MSGSIIGKALPAIEKALGRIGSKIDPAVYGPGGLNKMRQAAIDQFRNNEMPLSPLLGASLGGVYGAGYGDVSSGDHNLGAIGRGALGGALIGGLGGAGFSVGQLAKSLADVQATKNYLSNLPKLTHKIPQLEYKIPQQLGFDVTSKLKTGSAKQANISIPSSLSELKAGLRGADLGSKIVPGLMIGGGAGLAKGLYEDPGHDPRTGKKKSRIINALKNALGGGAVGSGLSLLAGPASSRYGAELGYNIGSKFGSDKQAAYVNWIVKAARIKMAKHLLRMEDLSKQLSNFDVEGLTKAAAQGHSKTARLKYTALAAQFLAEKQAFAALMSAMGKAPGAIANAMGKAPGAMANFMGGGARAIEASQPTRMLSQTGPGLYGRLNNALFPKQVIGQGAEATKPLLGRLNDAFFPRQIMKAGEEKQAFASVMSALGKVPGAIRTFGDDAFKLIKNNPGHAVAIGAGAPLAAAGLNQLVGSNDEKLQQVLTNPYAGVNQAFGTNLQTPMSYAMQQARHTIKNRQNQPVMLRGAASDKVAAEKQSNAFLNFIKARPVTSTLAGLAALPTVGGGVIGSVAGGLVGAGKGLYNTFAVPAAGLKDLSDRFSAGGQAFLNKGSGGSSDSSSGGGYTSPFMPRGYVSKGYNY